MAQKKKSKSSAKKETASSAKRKAPVKRVSARPAKKKAVATGRMKTKKGASKKKTEAITKKTQHTVRKNINRRQGKAPVPVAEIPTPEVIKQEETLPAMSMDNPTHMDKIEEHKIVEHQFENREHTMMNQENQRVKAALANRHSMKRVFRTPRSS